MNNGQVVGAEVANNDGQIVVANGEADQNQHVLCDIVQFFVGFTYYN